MKDTSQENKHLIMFLLDEAYACRTNNLLRSTELAQKSLALSQDLGDTALIARSLNLLSLFSMIKGEYETSLDMAAKAIRYYEVLKDERGIADAKYNIAGVYYKTDNYHLGLVNLVDCVAIYRKFNDYHNLSRTYKSLGTIYEYFGDEKKAVKAYEDAIESTRFAGNIDLESNAYNPLSGIYIKQKNIDKASELIERSIAIKLKTGDLRGLAFSYYGRGKVKLAEKKFAEAERNFIEAIDIHKKMGETLGLGMAYHKISNLYVEMGLLQKAKQALEQGLEFAMEHNIVMIKYKCYFLFYKVFKIENDPVNALKYLEHYHQQKETVINSQTLKIIENYELITQMESIETEARLQIEKAEIIKKKDLAEQAARVKQDFLSTMSHELRTPLNAVITIASLLGDKADKEEQRLLDSLKFASNNLLLIINDILDFTKLDAGKASLEMRPANFKLLLENIKKTYESLATEKGLRLNLNIGDDVGECYELDETKTSQILGNLVTNAIKFTDYGRVDINVKKLNHDEKFDLLRFEVFDTGIGISENHFESIFDFFSQPQTVTTRKQGGSGLGLAIVKKLIELHGSSIRLDSVLNKGSVFYFDLKFKKSDSPNRTISNRAINLSGKTVLLAEDNIINAMLIRKLLSKWDILSEHALNGIEAVEKSKSKVFDFILMDIHMPEMDGFDAATNIRKPENPNYNTPIFALTADVTAETKEENISLFRDFLRKPIEIDKLYDAIVNCLNESRVRILEPRTKTK